MAGAGAQRVQPPAVGGLVGDERLERGGELAVDAGLQRGEPRVRLGGLSDQRLQPGLHAPEAPVDRVAQARAQPAHQASGARAGTPCTRTPAGTSRTATAPAATTAPSPTAR